MSVVGVVSRLRRPSEGHGRRLRRRPQIFRNSKLNFSQTIFFTDVFFYFFKRAIKINAFDAINIVEFKQRDQMVRLSRQ